MDFESLATVDKHEAGAECNIMDPATGEPTDAFIRIQGADSKAWRAEKRKQTATILATKAGNKDGAVESLDFDEMDIDALVRVTIDWRGLTKDGNDYACNADNARALYSQSPSVVRQLLQFLGDGENFIKR